MIESLYPYILKIHIATVFVLVGIILYADALGTAWMRGKSETIAVQRIARAHHLMWGGLIVMLITGPLLFYPYKEFLLTHPPFLIKMSFVVALIINGLFIGKLMHVATTRTYASLTNKERFPLIVSGIVSTVSWIGGIVAATQIGL